MPGPGALTAEDHKFRKVTFVTLFVDLLGSMMLLTSLACSSRVGSCFSTVVARIVIATVPVRAAFMARA